MLRADSGIERRGEQDLEHFVMWSFNIPVLFFPDISTGCEKAEDGLKHHLKLLVYARGQHSVAKQYLKTHFTTEKWSDDDIRYINGDVFLMMWNCLFVFRAVLRSKTFSFLARFSSCDSRWNRTETFQKQRHFLRAKTSQSVQLLPHLFHLH